MSLASISLLQSIYQWYKTFEPRHDKTNKTSVPPVKTQISLGIHPVCSESSLCAQWVAKDPSFLQAAAKTLIRLGGCPGWSESSLGVHSFCWVLSCRGSFCCLSSRQTFRYQAMLFCEELNIAANALNMSRFMTKPTKLHVCPAKTQISLGIHLVWLEFSLSAWRKLGSLATHWASSEDWSDWGDAQADLSLRWAHSHFVGFVMRWLNYEASTKCVDVRK